MHPTISVQRYLQLPLGVEHKVPLFQLSEQHERLVVVLLIPREQQIRPPVGRIETPVARAVLQGAVRVSDEALRRELITALLAFDAHRIVRVEQLRIEHASALAEALVIHFELDDRFLLVLAFAAGLFVQTVLRLADLRGIAGLGA